MNWNPYLVGNSYLGNIVYTNWFTTGVVLASIFLVVFIIALIMRSGHGYSVQDAEAHSTNYASVIREGHGGMTAFLWILFTFMFIWTIVYFAQHAAEFNIWFAY